MKYQDPVTGEIKTVAVKAADSLPIGAIVEYEGAEIPKGYELVEDMGIVTDGEPTKAGYKVDGKDVYVKRINCGAGPNNESKYVSSGLDTQNTVDIIFLDGMATDSSGGFSFPLPYTHPSTFGAGITLAYSGYATTHKECVELASKSNRSATNVYVNIYFTYKQKN